MTTHPFVLLVEPDAILRELIRRELKDQGCVVFDAADPGEALAFAELYPGSIDLAVTDLPTTHHQDQLFTDALRSLPPGTHAQVLGEFNWSSQHLDDDEVLRCRNGDGEGQTGRVDLRCVRLAGRR